ncbi:MAG: hypothetical protein JKX96_03860, partial [Acinetobacter sp.]|nr:hypothetical protein [Acinetobacter sp.]
EKEMKKLNPSAKAGEMNVAKLFSSNLVADASVKPLERGYTFSLVIRDVETGQNVADLTYACLKCTREAVINKQFRGFGRRVRMPGQRSNGLITNIFGRVKTMIDDGVKLLPAKKIITPSPQVEPAPSSTSKINQAQSGDSAPAIFIFDSQPGLAAVTVNGGDVGVTPYQGLDHHVGEVLEIELTKEFYKPLTFEITLDSELLRMKEPKAMERGEGRLLVSFEPYKNGAEIVIDGVVQGLIPMQLTLAAGEHNIKIVYKGNVLGEQSYVVQHESAGKLVFE